MKPCLIKLCSCFILNKKQRSNFRKNKLEECKKNILNKLRFGVSYSVFDGVELLEASIKSIRSEVDYVNVVYQNFSWYGEPIDDKVIRKINDLKGKGLIDEIIEYKNDTSQSAGKQEIDKRNLGLKYAKKAKVNYFMTMDVDEFYYAPNVAEAKKIIVEKNITRSFVQQIMYGDKPTKLNLSYDQWCYVPFFSKINRFSKLGRNSKIPCQVDKTRRLQHSIFDKCFVLDKVAMHHMSHVRLDYNKKTRNSSTQQTKKEQKYFILHDGEATVKDVFEIMKYLKNN